MAHRVVVRRRLPAAFGETSLYVSPEGGLKYLKGRLGQVDPTLLALARETVQPGSVVWDIGANVGLFSFAAAALAGREGEVLAVEPDCWLVGLLRRSAGLPGQRADINVLPAAISDQVGVSRFHIARRSRATNHLDGFGSSQTGGSRSMDLVPTYTLDWLAERFPAPDVLKIDIEAAELLALRGGRDLLSRCRPTVICEVAGANEAEAGEMLHDLGYVLYDAEVPAKERTPTESASWMTLAMPAQRRAKR